MRYTIHDIARELGVSARTVGRVVNQQEGVGEETRKRVEAFIQEVGYRPHSGAQSLRRQASDSIGFMLCAPADQLPLSQDLLTWLFSQLYEVFGTHGKFISFDMNPPVQNGVRDYARGIWQQRFDASVIGGAFYPNDTTLARIHALGAPYVALARLPALPEACTGAVDYEEACYLSTRYLIEKGHTRIGVLQGLPHHVPGIERIVGYKRALDEAGLSYDATLIKPLSFAPKNLTNQFHRLLLDTNVSAVVDASGAQDAHSLREGVRMGGRMLGRDLDMVVWTYTSGAVVLREALAHVWLPVRETAAESIALLGDWLYERRDGPFQVLYRPVIYDTPQGEEVAKPKPVFEVHLEE